jgi:murein L,D-transpeptidase YafK
MRLFIKILGLIILIVVVAAVVVVVWMNIGYKPLPEGARTDREPLPDGVRADRIVIEKSRRQLTLLKDGKPLKTYAVALGGSPTGPKEREGDGKTPEGVYHIDYRKANSSFHRALHISYPSAAEVEAARKGGYPPGGAIMIHGLPNGFGGLGASHRLRDWTLGCIAVTNIEIEEIWRVVPNGAVVEIRP